MIAAYEKKIAETAAYMEAMQEEDEQEEDGILEIARLKSGKKRPTTSNEASSTASNKRITNKKGPLDFLFSKEPEESIKLGKIMRQTSVNESYNKAARDRAVQYIARFFFRNGIAFNVAKSKSFKLMIEAIGSYGPHLKPPSYHELRVPLLKKELEYTKGLLRGHEEERIKYGCSIMSDGWMDRKNRTLINFLVNCSLGTQFVRSVDASEYMKTGQKIFELLDSFVEEIEEKNVIQVVTDNGSNYVLAEDIGKIPKVKRVIQRGIKLVSYIYNHTLTLNIMRKFTQKTELVRHGVTRFATTFLTLQRLHKQKANLKRMFTSDEWLKSKAAKETKGKQVIDVVLMSSLWNDVVYTLKAMGPLFFYTNPNIDNDNEVVDVLYKCTDRFNEDDDFVVEVHKQLLVYKRVGERFGMTVAMKARTEISLAEWWKLYGGKTPHLQTIAIKVLSLTCSSSGFGIHSKKRSKLEHQKLQDLVYVKYNQALLDRFVCHDVIDPIALNDIDDSNEWLLEESEGEEAGTDLVFDEDDDLNWLDVLRQLGLVNLYKTQESNTYKQDSSRTCTYNEKGKKVVEVEEENGDEGEEEYNYNASESDGFQEHNDLDLEENEDSD
ncbi:hypothetical protein GLYMA_19G069000v4 [Glycine max]|uniref:DUF659 domain-containing protein n=1 Tax=Glycine max TaxID=3847 RepID=A0A0R0EIZ7_SOYBN|nr:hypothetical protein GYH30_052233 [Glycine max]KRG94217.1 hypothetical protein GLYMA_19G069000v4 [Glycine max]